MNGHPTKHFLLCLFTLVMSMVISMVMGGMDGMGGMASSAWARHADLLFSYEFDAERSQLGVTGGFAGIDETLTIEGGFNLHFRADHGDLFPHEVIFRDVDAKVTGGHLFPDQRLDDVLNLPGLSGRFVNENQIAFTGVEGQGFSMMLTGTRDERMLTLEGVNAPLCCDTFSFHISALADLAPLSPPRVVGDMDGNGVLDAFDVDEFERLLASAPALVGDDSSDSSAHEIADMNGDGRFDAFDVAAFEAALADADDDHATPHPVPEPTTGLAVVIIAGAMISTRRRP